MKHFNKFWVYALVLSIFIALIIWRMQRQSAASADQPQNAQEQPARR
jgi:hypothetical protein